MSLNHNTVSIRARLFAVASDVTEVVTFFYLDAMVTRDPGRELHGKTSLCLQISQQWQSRPAPLTSLTAHQAEDSLRVHRRHIHLLSKTTAAQSHRTQVGRDRRRTCEEHQELGVANEGKGDFRSSLVQRRRMVRGDDICEAQRRPRASG